MMEDNQTAFTTERFTVSHVHCERNEEFGFCGRDVYVAFHRLDDIPKPLCVVTLFGNWVEWIETASDYRRQGIGREVLAGLEKHVGCLELYPATEEGDAFVDAVCGPEEPD